MRNRLNDLTPREWLLFQKSWFVHNPPPREKEVLLHPAKFPESLCQEFIEFFTKRGQIVLDPMAGTGSALIAALRSGRSALGVELNPKYAAIAQQRVVAELQRRLPLEDERIFGRVIEADARDLPALGLESVDYVLTSPPYWDMLRRQGFETQKKRRESPDLDMYYSDDEADLGNVDDYGEFLAQLVVIYRRVAEVMRPGAYATIIVKNVKKGGRMYPLAWDLGRLVGDFLDLKDEKIWCQDNQRLAPYGMGNVWVSNTMHHYCLNFRKPLPPAERPPAPARRKRTRSGIQEGSDEQGKPTADT
jgi:DNA modification methylase